MLWARCSNANPSLMRDDQKHRCRGMEGGEACWLDFPIGPETNSSSAKSMRLTEADALCSPVEDAHV